MKKRMLALTLCAILSLSLLTSCAGTAQEAEGEESASLSPSVSSEDTDAGSTVYVFTDALGDVDHVTGGTEEIPVTVEISYTLDGREVSPEDLAGASGHLEICYDCSVTQTRPVGEDGTQNETTVPFVLLAGILLQDDVASDVTVSFGKVADDGDHTVVVGLALPGLGENLDLEEEDIPEGFTLSADVTNFSMMNSYLYATCEPFQDLNLDSLDSLEDLEGSMDEIQDAMTQLMEGSADLYDGLCTLLERCEELTQGVEELSEGTGKLRQGADQVNAGAESLLTGSQSLSQGLGTLDENSASLNEGARQVFETLLSAADSQLAQAGLEVPTLTISNYASVLDGVISSLDPEGLAAQARETARAQVTQAVYAQRDTVETAVRQAVEETVTEQVTAAVQAQVQEQVELQVREQVQAGVLATLGMTPETYQRLLAAGMVSQELQDMLQAAVEEQMASQDIQTTISAAVAEQMVTGEIRAAIDEAVLEQMASDEVAEQISVNTEAQVEALIEENMASSEVQSQITQALQSAASGAAEISELKEQLDAYAQFYNGLLAYTAGVSSAKDGASQLSQGAGALAEGTASLAEGAAELEEGVLTLSDGIPELIDGITQLRDGSGELMGGLTQFNDEAVSQLVSLVDGDLNGLVTHLRNSVTAAQRYLDEGGSSFLFRTEAIGQ